MQKDKEFASKYNVVVTKIGGGPHSHKDDSKEEEKKPITKTYRE